MEGLHGLRAHFKRAAFKQRAGLDQSDTNEKGYKKTGPLLVETLLEGEGPKKAAGGKGKAAPRPNGAANKPGTKVVPKKAAAVEEPEPEVEVEEVEVDEAAQHALAYVLEQIEANGGGAEKDALPKKVFKYAKDNGLENAVRNQILEYVGSEDWLNGQEEYFEFDGETLTAV